jgi:hypothetical protein
MNEVIIYSDFENNVEANIPIIDFELDARFEHRDFTSSNTRLFFKVPLGYDIPQDHVVVVSNAGNIKFLGFSQGREQSEDVYNNTKKYTYFGIEEVIYNLVNSDDFEDMQVGALAASEEWGGVSLVDADFGKSLQHRLQFAKWDDVEQIMDYYSEDWMVWPYMIAKIFEYLAKQGLEQYGIEEESFTSAVLITDHIAGRILSEPSGGDIARYPSWSLSEFIERYRLMFNLVYSFKWKYDQTAAKWVMQCDLITLNYKALTGNNTVEPLIVDNFLITTDEPVYEKPEYKFIDFDGNDYESDPGNEDAIEVNIYHNLPEVRTAPSAGAYIFTSDGLDMVFFKEGVNPAVSDQLNGYEFLLHCRPLVLSDFYTLNYAIDYETIVTAEFNSVDLPETFDLYRDFTLSFNNMVLMVTAITLKPGRVAEIVARNYSAANQL